MTSLHSCSEKCCVINQVTCIRESVARGELATRRLHYPATRSKVVNGNLVTVLWNYARRARSDTGTRGRACSRLGLGILTSIWLKRISAAILVAALCGCGGSQVVVQDPTIPKPLIDQFMRNRLSARRSGPSTWVVPTGCCLHNCSVRCSQTSRSSRKIRILASYRSTR
jgi:hypothetical protein